MKMRPFLFSMTGDYFALALGGIFHPEAGFGDRLVG
jgi:hypothetical protein